MRAVAAELSRSGQTSAGCITHIAHQREDDARLFCWLEQWRDEDSLGARVATLGETFGAPRGEEGLDALPAGLANELESLEATRYRVVAT